MAILNAADASLKTVGDPNTVYETIKPTWNRNRAVCSGEKYVKDYDSHIDTRYYRNLLIPFSPSMSNQQFAFYKAEAELPGITSQFSKMLVGGLLRKKPILELPESVPEDCYNWIMNEFGKDDSSLTSFLDNCLWEEVQTSRAWVFVDYPKIDPSLNLSKEELLNYKPYPILRRAEEIINWRVSENNFGKHVLDRVVVKGYTEIFERNEFHPEYVETVWVHELDEDGYYQIRVYTEQELSNNVPVISGHTQIVTEQRKTYELVDLVDNIANNGERLTFIPAWPLNGSIEPYEPLMTPIVDKEISLYNKISRRNHLLYGASSYTPMILSDMPDEEFQAIVDAGLGSWIKLRQGDDARVLETPTAALADMDRAISACIEEMAKLGVRMMSPETSQSGIALEIRNAAQSAQLGLLNNKVSNTMRQIITFMINWRYGLDIPVSDVKFSMSADFNAQPIGADWLRLATEWYQAGLLPRSNWLELLKNNDIVSSDYDDQVGREEITQDLEISASLNENYANNVSQ